MFFDMDYCQWSALINNTAMDILMHKAFFINLFYECLAGKENWETYVIFEDIVQWLCLYSNRDRLAFLTKFFFWKEVVGSRREAPLLNQLLEFSWHLQEAIVWLTANLVLSRNPLSITLFKWVLWGQLRLCDLCSWCSLSPKKLYVIIFLAKCYSTWSPPTGSTSLFPGIISQRLLEKSKLFPKIKDVLALRIFYKIYSCFYM